MTTDNPRVFISYSHDSAEHRARVLGLSERLVQLDPTNAIWRNDLAWLRERLDAL